MSAIAKLLRWLLPCVVAAMAAALIAGASEAILAGLGPLGTIIAIGFAAMFAGPALIIAAVAARLVFRAWWPRVQQLIDADGNAHRFAAALFVGLLAIATWSMVGFQVIWRLFRSTQFGPHVVAVGNALVMGVTGILMIAGAPIVYDIVARVFAALAQRWYRRTQRRLFVVHHVVIGSLCVGAAATFASWRVIAVPSLGHIDLSILIYPVAATFALAAVSLLFGRFRTAQAIRVRRWVGAGIVAACTTSIGIALLSLRQWPVTTLDVWADCPVAGLSIDRQFEIENVRRLLPLAAFRPVEAANANGKHPSIILITIDTFRADRTPPYGGPAPMPHLLSLAARGVVFDWAFAPGNVTRRSMPSMFIGLDATRVRGRVTGWSLKLDPRHVTLAERLQQAGYNTAAFVCCDSFWGPSASTGWDRGIKHLVTERNGDKLTDGAIDWLTKQNTGAPTFVWLHYIEPHNWTTEPVKDADRRSPYDTVLGKVDTMLGRLLQATLAQPPEQQPLIIVTGDHGESLFEHGTNYHSSDLFNTQIRVPLIMAGAGLTPARIGETVSGTDLVPTILELAGFVPPTKASADIDGRSIADLVRRTRIPDITGGYAFAAMIRDRSNPGGQRAVLQGSWKLYQRGDSMELYNFRDDPAELNNIANARPDMVAKLRVLLDAASVRDRLTPFVP